MESQCPATHGPAGQMQDPRGHMGCLIPCLIPDRSDSPGSLPRPSPEPCTGGPDPGKPVSVET